MPHRFLSLLLSLPLPLATLQPATAHAQDVSARAQVPVVPPRLLVVPEPTPPSGWRWDHVVTTERMVQGAGALLGIVAFNFYVAPLSAASGVGAAATIRGMLGTRVVASSLAATGAALTTYLYDRWNDRPIDYNYLWSRGGAVVGVGVGSALLTVLGFPSSTALSRFSPAWTANRAFLVGSGFLGGWLTDFYLPNDKRQLPDGQQDSIPAQ